MPFACRRPVSDLEHFELKHPAEAFQLWVAALRRRFPQGQVTIALELSRGSPFYALMTYDFLALYPFPPKALADYRQALAPCRRQNDPGDAQLLLEFLRKHPEHFRPWVADDGATLAIALLVHYRRKLVDGRTALSNLLQALLKGYFPQTLEGLGDLTAPWAWDFLSAFPSLAAAQQASRFHALKIYRAHTCRPPEQRKQLLAPVRTARSFTAVIESSALMGQAPVDQSRALAAGLERLEKKLAELFAAHPDQAIFASFRGGGPALAPRPLAAWGTNRQRYPAADDLQWLSGTAPSPARAGKSVGCIGAWPVPNPCARPSRSSTANRFSGRPGRGPIPSTCTSAARTITAPSAHWPSSGFAFSIVAGKIIRFTRRPATSRRCSAGPRPWPLPCLQLPNQEACA